MTTKPSIINTAHSKVSFSIKKLGFINIKGTISDMKGAIFFDENNLSKSNFSVSISPITIDTGSAKRDEHLKSNDFFYVKDYPKISFESTSIEKENNHFVVTGSLTLLKTSKEISTSFTFQNGILKADFSLNRLDYGLGSKFPTFIVGKTVQIHINIKIK